MDNTRPPLPLLHSFGANLPVIICTMLRPAMTPPLSREPSYSVRQQTVRSSFCVLPHDPRPARNASFIFGRSDSRYRPLLNQEERDRLHMWAMIVALSSSVAGTTLLLTAIFR